MSGPFFEAELIDGSTLMVPFFESEPFPNPEPPAVGGPGEPWSEADAAKWQAAYLDFKKAVGA